MKLPPNKPVKLEQSTNFDNSTVLGFLMLGLTGIFFGSVLFFTLRSRLNFVAA